VKRFKLILELATAKLILGRSAHDCLAVINLRLTAFDSINFYSIF